MVAGRQTVELHNVMVGDVWLCGGQSNMGLPLRFTRNGEEEVKGANYPEIRFFTVATRVAHRHADQLEGKWSVVSPSDSGSDLRGRVLFRAQGSAGDPHTHWPGLG
jgi:sialate O-acetylesterase